MKLSKKLLYSAMAFTMLTSATVAPVAQIIPSSTVRAEVKSQPTRPETTTVNIYKLQADSYNIEIVNSNGIANKDGEALANYDNLGKNVKGLAGVQFKRYKIKDTSQLTDNELKQLTSLELADAKVQTGDLETGISLQQKNRPKWSCYRNFRFKNKCKVLVC